MTTRIGILGLVCWSLMQPAVATAEPPSLGRFNAGWTFLQLSPFDKAAIVADGPVKAWANQGPVPSAPNFAVLRAQGAVEQSFTVVNPGVHTIAYRAQVRYLVAGTQTMKVSIDGAVVNSPAGIARFAWTAKSFTVNLAAGPHTLRFAGQATTDEAMFLDSVTITDPLSLPVALPNGNFDSYILAPDQTAYAPPAIASASLGLTASVTTSGKLLYCRLARASGGAAVQPGQVNEAPTLSVNGVAVGAIATAGMLTTSAHPTFLVPMPAGVVVAPGDVVTLSASEGWIFGGNGYAAPMAAQPVANNVGRSFVRTVDAPRTMAVGASYANYTTPEWCNGFLPRNQRYRCEVWVPKPISQDLGGKPLVMAQPSGGALIVKITTGSIIDATGYPTPEGYWAVRWDDLDGGTSFGLSQGQDGNGSVVEVPSLANPGVGGVGKVRVFDCRRSGPGANFELWLMLAKADKLPHFDNLAILAPGDFAWTADTPTVIPMPRWDEVSALVDAKLPPSLPFGPHRVTPTGLSLGDSSSCEREHFVEPADFRWAGDVKTGVAIRYTQARPWDAAVSPYIYDPLAGTDYPATLGADIATAPVAGTTEVITIPDAATAPVIAGLVLTIGQERIRVKSVSGTAATVMRGAESTTPAVHAAGPISVSARRPLADLSGVGTNQQVTELVTESPHRLKSGQIVQMDGGWPNFSYADGSAFRGGGFTNWHLPTYVTGANTFLTIWPGAAATANVTLSRAYALTSATSTVTLPESGGIPHEYGATLAARHPGAPAWISFTNAASNDWVDEIWRRILPYLPADRDVWVELGDEPWNYAGSPSSHWYATSAMLYGVHSPYHWYAVRVAQIKARGRAIWEAAGRDPLRVKSSLNVQCAGSGLASLPGLLNFLAARNSTPDAIAIAPYYVPYPDPAMYRAFGAWDTDMLVDAWIWDYYDNASGEDSQWGGGQARRIGGFKSALNAWNAAHGANVGLVVYEYAPGLAWPLYAAAISTAMDATSTTLTLSGGVSTRPRDDLRDDAAKVQPGTWLLCGGEWMTVVSRSGTTCTVNRGQGGTTAIPHAAGTYIRNDVYEGTRDLTLHPNFRIAHFDALALLQAKGVAICIPSSLQQDWVGGNAWADYHAIAQLPGSGDGSDGKADNRLSLARRGQPGSKAATVNQDASTVSVRGQAMIDFLRPRGGDGQSLAVPGR